MKKFLSIKDLFVVVDNNRILNGINLEVKSGQIHAIIGPNGSGKSTLALTLMGHPKYEVESGQILFKGRDITNLDTDQRAKLGIFLSFQNPYEIDGMTLRDFLHQSYNSVYADKHLGPREFNELLAKKMSELDINGKFVDRYVNVGFSGGEKKKAEALQLSLLEPVFAILDELDSGLDMWALDKTFKVFNKLKSLNPNMSILIITHYQKILKFLKPDRVHVMQHGRIVRSGSSDLITKLDNV